MADAILSPIFKQQFFDNNGNPLAGGQLSAFQAGSAGSLRKDTYSSINLTAKNTNPIILDDFGRANVWLSPDGAYLFILKDKLGNTIWTVDNVEGASGVDAAIAAIQKVLASNSGAGMIGTLTGVNLQLRINAMDITISGKTDKATTDALTTRVADAEQDIVELKSTTANGGTLYYPTWAALVAAFSAYNAGTAYTVSQTVVDQGVAWVNILGSTGIAPPTLPDVTNANWELFRAPLIGQVASVPLTDAGTHTDPTTGATVNNTGVFSWQTGVSGTGFKYLFANDAALASGFAASAAVSADNAEAAEQGAVAALASLYAPSQVIGRPVAPITGTVTSVNSFLWANSVASGGLLSKFVIFALAAGTVQIASYTKSGTTVTRKAISPVVAIASSGVKTLTPTDFGTFPVDAGDFLAVYANGVLVFTSATADGLGWYSFAASLPSSGTVGAINTTFRLQASFEISTQIVSGTTFTALQNEVHGIEADVAELQDAVDLLSDDAVQIIGRPAGAVLSATSSSGADMYVSADPATLSGKLTSVDYYAYAAGIVEIGVFTLTAGVFTRTGFGTVNVPSTGVHTLTPADFGDIDVGLGQYIGMAGTGRIGYTNQSADVGYYSLFVHTGGAAGPVSTIFRFQYRFTVTGREQIVTAEAFKALEASAQGNNLRGKKIGFVGDSLTASYAQIWQTAFIERTDAVLWRQDARSGRTFSSALEAYGASVPLASLGSIGTYNNAATLGGAIPTTGTIGSNNIYGQVPANGTTLAQWLADLDLLVIWLGTNDSAAYESGLAVYAGGVGTINDAYTANTMHGAINFVLDAYLTNKPDLKIIGVNTYRNAESSPTGQQNFADATAANFKSRGIPILNPRETWGISALTASTLLRSDGIHMTDASFARIAGPTIANFASQQV